MNAREIFYRIRQLFTLLSLRIRYHVGIRYSYAPGNRLNYQFMALERQLPTLNFDLDRMNQEAEILLRGDVVIGTGAWHWQDSVEIWRRAPDTGRLWPNGFFGSIRYREGNPYGDIRLLWEPSRLQHLAGLAVFACSLSGKDRERALNTVESQLVSWVDCNRALAGPHYVSAMECALRVIAVCHTLDTLRDDIIDRSQLWTSLIHIIESHAPLIEKRLSLHSSTGNHTVAESAGLIYAGLLFPEVDGARRWMKKGLAILSEAARVQILPDGGGIEQALWYHRFNLQLLGMVAALLQHHSSKVPGEIVSALDRGRRFLGSMMVDKDRLPPIGDSDDGHALSKYLVLDTYDREPATDVRVFQDTGYTVVQIAYLTESWLIFDHGPIGMAPAYAHGHSDALSLLLRVSGVDVLIDPGTYTYTGDPKWRRYFRSTAAHNTVTVDDRDQAIQEGAFLWSSPFRGRMIDYDDERRMLVAQHDGFCNVGVKHVRGIGWLQGQWILVWDRLIGRGAHKLDLHWHLGVTPLLIDNHSFVVPLNSGTVGFRCLGGEVSMHRGEHAPPLAWRSPSYSCMEPCTTARVSFEGNLPHDFTTLITLPGGIVDENATRNALDWIKARAH